MQWGPVRFARAVFGMVRTSYLRVIGLWSGQAAPRTW